MYCYYDHDDNCDNGDDVSYISQSSHDSFRKIKPWKSKNKPCFRQLQTGKAQYCFEAYEITIYDNTIQLQQGMVTNGCSYFQIYGRIFKLP